MKTMGETNLQFLREQIGCGSYTAPTITGYEIALLAELVQDLLKLGGAMADGVRDWDTGSTAGRHRARDAAQRFREVHP